MQFLMPSPTILLFAVLCISCLHRENAGGQVQPKQSTEKTATVRTLRSACEDCELMFVGMPGNINSVDTSRGWFEEGQRLLVRGNVFHSDGSTPATDVLLYYYHTDKKGIYAPGPGLPQQARRHGYLRGWVKTSSDGSYAIYTNRPAQYPEGRIEAHIHVIVKEPDIDNPYWIDAWIFDDDPLVTEALKSRLENRGGNGILTVKTENDVQMAHHDIILGLNVPGYPVK
jgi:protocatechuate 3,4-dioxygenase beta subunit